MAEHPKIAYARKYCRERNLRYQIKGSYDALFLYVPQIGHYVQACFSLLNFQNDEEIAKFIDKEIKNYHLM